MNIRKAKEIRAAHEGNFHRVIAPMPDLPRKWSRITNPRIEEFAAYVAEGMSYTHAGELIGYTRRTTETMKAEGQTEFEQVQAYTADGEDMDLAELSMRGRMYYAYLRASAWYKLEMIRAIQGHMAKDWKAGQWLMQKRFIAEFGTTEAEEDAQTLKVVIMAPATAATEAEWMSQTGNVIEGSTE